MKTVRVERYVNRNPMPVSIPNPRGVNDLVPPGGFYTNPWYSRFCSHGMLTREIVVVDVAEDQTPEEAILVKDRRRTATPPMPPPKLPPSPPLTVSPKPPVKDVAGPGGHWKRARGVYKCAHCDGAFATGSLHEMRTHIEGFHGISLTPNVRQLHTNPLFSQPDPAPASELEPAPPAAPPALPKVPPLQAALERVDTQPMDPTQLLDERNPPQPVEPPLGEGPPIPEEPEGYPCPQCARLFKTQAGLASHARAKHKEE